MNIPYKNIKIFLVKREVIFDWFDKMIIILRGEEKHERGYLVFFVFQSNSAL